MNDSDAQLQQSDIENALHAARMGIANDDDWSLIYYAAGLTQPITKERKSNDIDGQRRGL